MIPIQSGTGISDVTRVQPIPYAANAGLYAFYKSSTCPKFRLVAAANR